MTQKVRYHEIRFTKEEKDLLEETSKHYFKKQRDTRKGRSTPCSWVWRTDIVKVAIPPKALCPFTAVPIRMPMTKK